MSEMKAIRIAYGEALAELGGKNDKVVVLDADLAHATQTAKFLDKYPERFFNCGIAEANMVSIAAGLSTQGFVPFASTFAMFGAGRAYEQVRNSVAYPNFNVKLAMTHAGICVGEDGGSHQSIEDIALMRVIPGMTVIVPCDANEARKAVFAAADLQGPVYLRFARCPSPILDMDMPFEIGKANVLNEGSDAVVFACGTMVPIALDAAKELEAEGIKLAVVNVHTIKPIDRETVLTYANKCKKVITFEEHSVIGGLGDAVSDVLMGQGSYSFKKLGVQDKFGQSGKPDELFAEYGLTKEDLIAAVKAL
ncbi:MAG: transketolase family protein [Lachnospiraceae bacterium]|nr:transketolase family protein [Lachnospiraceae bacterium]